MDIFTFFPSWLLSVVFVLSLSCILIHTLTRKSSSMEVTYMLPPNPPKLPIIGNLHQLLGKHRPRTLWQLSQKYGPVMLLHLGSKPFVVISSSTMAKQVLKTQDHMLCSRPTFKGSKRLTYNFLDVAFSPYDSHWREMRKVLVSEFLGIKRAIMLSHVMEREMEGLVRSLSLQPSNTVIKLDKMLLAMVNGIVCKVAYGKSYREEPFNGATLKEMIDESMVMFGGSFADIFPKSGWILDKLSGWNGRLDKCFANLDGYFEMILDEHFHPSTDERSDYENDVVHSLIELSSKENTRLTKNDMKALVMDVLTGGIDTTVTTMVWAMSEIVRNPRVKQKLQTEIRNSIGRKLKVEASDITKTGYLKMVVKETLRLHPPAPFLVPHECIGHCQIGGYDVFPGTGILVNAWGIARDRSTWGDNVSEFYPERFEDLEFDFGGKHFEMIPFGGGRRSCPGMNSAIANVELTLANLLYWFDWEVPDGMKNDVLDMEEEGNLVISKKSSLCLVPIKHTWQDK